MSSNPKILPAPKLVARCIFLAPTIRKTRERGASRTLMGNRIRPLQISGGTTIGTKRAPLFPSTPVRRMLSGDVVLQASPLPLALTRNRSATRRDALTRARRGLLLLPRHCGRKRCLVSVTEA
jgi:hypothetical protein